MEGLVGGLVGGVEEDVPAAVDEGHGALRFQKGVLGPRGLEMPGGGVGGPDQGPCRVPPGYPAAGADVVRCALEDPLRALCRLPDVPDGGENLVLHPDEGLGLLQGLLILRGD